MQHKRVIQDKETLLLKQFVGQITALSLQNAYAERKGVCIGNLRDKLNAPLILLLS